MEEKTVSTVNKINPSTWVGKYADYLFNYALSRINHKEIAQDLVQDTFLSAVKALNTFKNQSGERTWLTSILKNKIIDHYKKRSTQSEKTIGKNEEEQGAFFETEGSRKGLWTAASRPIEWPGNYRSELEKKEFYHVLSACLSKLPSKTETVFRLKNLEDKDADEICKELGISSSNYWVIMHRAKLQLQACMTRNWFNLGKKK